MFCRCQPLPGEFQKVGLAHTGMSCKDDFGPVFLRKMCHCRQIVGEDRLEWFLVSPFWVLRCQGMHAVECKDGLGVNRMLNPQRSILVEGGDTVFRRYLVGGGADEVQDRLFCRPIVP